jgi:arylsulfatase A-like enzyme
MQNLGYLAQMLEVGVPVVYGYISDAHDNHAPGGGAYGPGEFGYVQQLAAYDDAFGKFFTRLENDGITKENTLFIVTAAENDHFAGGPPSPTGYDGINVPCTYVKKGEVNGDLRKVVFTETGDATPFTVHSGDAPTVYITGNPTQTDPTTRKLEREMGALIAINPITGNTDMLTQALADHAEQGLLHMISADPNRTPTFILFGNPDYFLTAFSASLCTLPACFVENPAFAWNHHDFHEEITKTWLGMVGPGIKVMGQTDGLFSDHTDIRPTMLTLVGLTDSYSHDGRALFEVIDDTALPGSLTKYGETQHRLADALKQINAPRGVLGMVTLTGIST